MIKRKLLYDAGNKKIYDTESDDRLVMVFSDHLHEIDGKLDIKVKGKGLLNNSISAQIFEYLGSYNILTHFIGKCAEREMHVKRIDLLPIEVIIYNGVEKSLSRKYGFVEGTILSVPVIEYHYKNEKLKNPVVNETHLGALDLVSQEEVSIFNRMIVKTNAVLKAYFERRGLFLVELHLSFGRYKGNLYIGDEISPDTCQFWGINGEDNFDKELYRQEKANSDIAYKKIVERLKGSIAS